MLIFSLGTSGIRYTTRIKLSALYPIVLVSGILLVFSADIYQHYGGEYVLVRAAAALYREGLLERLAAPCDCDPHTHNCNQRSYLALLAEPRAQQRGTTSSYYVVCRRTFVVIVLTYTIWTAVVELLDPYGLNVKDRIIPILM